MINSFKDIQDVSVDINPQYLEAIIKKYPNEYNIHIFKYVKTLDPDNIDFNKINTLFFNEKDSNLKKKYYEIFYKNKILMESKKNINETMLKMSNGGFNNIKYNSLRYLILYYIEKNLEEKKITQILNDDQYTNDTLILKLIQNYNILVIMHYLISHYLKDYFEETHYLSSSKLQELINYLKFQEQYKNLDKLEEYANIEIPESIQDFIHKVISSNLDYIKPEKIYAAGYSKIVQDKIKINGDEQRYVRFIYDVMKKNPNYQKEILPYYNIMNNPYLQELLLIDKPKEHDYFMNMYKEKEYLIDSRLHDLYQSEIANELYTADPAFNENISKDEFIKGVNDFYTTKNLRKNIEIDGSGEILKNMLAVNSKDLDDNSLHLKSGDMRLFTMMEFIEAFKNMKKDDGAYTQRSNHLTINLNQPVNSLNVNDKQFKLNN